MSQAKLLPRAPAQVALHPNNYPNREGDLLVAFGIDTLFGRVVTRVLVLLMLLQPVYVAMGMELDANAEERGINAEETRIDAEQTQNDAEEEAQDETDAITDVNTSEAERDRSTYAGAGTGTESGDEDAAAGTDSTAGISGGVLDDEQEQDQSDTASTTDDIVQTGADGPEHDTASTTSAVADESDDASPESDADGAAGGANDAGVGDSTQGADGSANENTEQYEETATSSEDIVDDLETSNATTTSADTTAELHTASSTTNSENKYTFGEGDCTLVADGEFYCVATDVTRHVDGDPRAYAEKDREGDREIYYFDGVEVKRITNNGYDDFAPVYDEETGRIVWQALLNDRLQIMLYDLTEGETHQVTYSRSNSSNPHILDDMLVWQEWVDTNWEIMMLDLDELGTMPQQTDGEELQSAIQHLTDNVVHDMFPQIYDGLITWQREKGRSWEVIVYDIRSGKEHALEKSGDTKFENPRFVLLFDSRHDNGDVETVGYDLESGEMMALGTRARPIPADPQTPKDEAPDALPRTGTSTSELKPVREGDSGDGL